MYKTEYGEDKSQINARAVLLKGKSLNRDSILKSRQDSSISLSEIQKSKTNTQGLDTILIENPLIKDAI